MNRHHHYHEEIITIRNQYPVYMHYMTRWKIEKESILLQSSNRTSILKMASFPAFIILIPHPTKVEPRVLIKKVHSETTNGVLKDNRDKYYRVY